MTSASQKKMMKHLCRSELDKLIDITALVKANVLQNKPTDVYQAAKELQRLFPALCQNELVGLIEYAVVTLRGAAIWNRS